MATLLEERPVTRDPEVTVRVVGESTRYAGGGGGRRITPGNVLSTAGLGAIAIAILLVVGAITGLVHIGNPFKATTTDQSPRVLLKSIKNLSEFNAAQGGFQSRIELEDDVWMVPSFIAGSKVDFDAYGTVDATVDFSVLGTDAVEVSADGGSVNITLPPPSLGGAVIDPTESKVVNRDRGLVNRIGDLFEDNPTSERELYLRAEKKINRAARDSNLVERAKQNTEAMLTAFLGRLGFENVTVSWTEPAPKAAANA